MLKFQLVIVKIYLWDTRFNPTIDKIKVQRKTIFITETGSFKINIPAKTVNVAPNPDQTA